MLITFDTAEVVLNQPVYFMHSRFSHVLTFFFARKSKAYKVSLSGILDSTITKDVTWYFLVCLLPILFSLWSWISGE